MLDAHTHLLMQAELNAFNKHGDQNNVFTGCADEGDAVVLPPGFFFADLSAHSGFCGLKLNYMHRGCLDTLTALKQDASVFQGELEDPAVKEVVKENVTCVCVCACLRTHRSICCVRSLLCRLQEFSNVPDLTAEMDALAKEPVVVELEAGKAVPDTEDSRGNGAKRSADGAADGEKAPKVRKLSKADKPNPKMGELWWVVINKVKLKSTKTELVLKDGENKALDDSKVSKKRRTPGWSRPRIKTINTLLTFPCFTLLYSLTY